MELTCNLGLVKYACGCIGFPPDSDGHAVLIRTCDQSRDDSEYCLFVRDMKLTSGEFKSHEELPIEEQVGHIRALGSLVADGDKLRTIKSLLR